MTAAVTKAADAFRSISEAAEELGLGQHVLRFWETKFPFLRPVKTAGGRRFYRPADMEILCAVRKLLYDDELSIAQVQALHRQHGPKGRPLQQDASLNSVRVTSNSPRGTDLARLRSIQENLKAAKIRLDLALA